MYPSQQEAAPSPTPCHAATLTHPNPNLYPTLTPTLMADPDGAITYSVPRRYSNSPYLTLTHANPNADASPNPNPNASPDPDPDPDPDPNQVPRRYSAFRELHSRLKALG